MRDNTVLGSQYNALRDNNVTNYLTGVRHLRPRPVDPLREMPNGQFVWPQGFDDALRSMRPAHGGGGSAVHVVVLLAPEAHGRRSAALQLLASVPAVQGRVFELLPDWEEPDESCLPRERNAGYLLNLRGVVDPLPADFYTGLSEYATAARSESRYLVVIASERAWVKSGAGARSGIVVAPLGRPDAVEIVKKALDAQEATRGRADWLNEDESVFRDQLPEKAPPVDAVRLAAVIGKAVNFKDDSVLDEYRGWKELVNGWFGGTDPGEPPKRAIRISAAFLEGVPASVVLNCADLLLKHPKVNWPAEEGGLLAGPDAATRTEQAGVDFDPASGAASLEEKRPGLGQAVLQYLWLRREQLVPVMRQWLQDISATKGPANDHLTRLATALTGLAETAGIATVFDLVDKWLDSVKKEDRQLAAGLLSQLAAHPVLGAQTRKKLAGWARGKSSPVRQRAVVQACGGSFGRTFTSEALTRLRYVLEAPGDSSVQPEAIATLRALAAQVDLSLQVVDAVVSWCGTVPAGSDSFMALFGLAETDSRSAGIALVNQLLETPGAQGQAIRARLTDGWRHLFESDEDDAWQALIRWRRAAEAGELPVVEVSDVIIDLADVRSSPLNHPIKRVIAPSGPLHDSLVDRFLDKVLQSVDPGHTSTDSGAEGAGARPTEHDDSEPLM
ncbi:hypothetical protein ACFWC9_01025 [Streptomyces goshikiensis]|uniref:hypothetical protein n=1 Tax=Streptomyces goshikiensis TaxID=1942 RepID=UPI00369AE52E